MGGISHKQKGEGFWHAVTSFLPGRTYFLETWNTSKTAWKKASFKCKLPLLLCAIEIEKCMRMRLAQRESQMLASWKHLTKPWSHVNYNQSVGMFRLFIKETDAVLKANTTRNKKKDKLWFEDSSYSVIQDQTGSATSKQNKSQNLAPVYIS